ncbi:MAG: heparinase II/III family protein [Rhodospirillaceae bacterium]|nr:heparinase II/III family protein [Rhodospirillaceae bacterium]
MAGAEAGSIRRQAHRLLFGNPVYGLTLGRTQPTHLRLVPPDPWPGSAERGQELLAGVYHFAGETVQTARPNWTPLGAGEDYLAGLHGFSWLRDLRALGGDTARRHARLLVDDWLDACSAWHPVIWRPDVIGRRLASWATGHDFFCASADDDARRAIFASMARQLRHLARTAPGQLRGLPAWSAVYGLALGAVCLPGGDRLWPRAGKLVDHVLSRQIRPDGGVADRNPMTMAAILRDLIDLRATLNAAASGLTIAGVDGVRTTVQDMIDRLALGLRTLRHGDGRLALFHGAQEGDRVLLDTILSHAGSRVRVARSSTIGGYRRLGMGRVVILMDTETVPPPGDDRDAHAAPLAIEMSVGRERMVVNCGAWDGRGGKSGPVWHTALRGTAAHSTLVVDGANCVPVLDGGGLGPATGGVAAEAVDPPEGLLAEAAHSHYKARFGVTHHRRIWVAESGEDIRGEDTLQHEGPHTRAEGAEPLAFTVRFHLHPDVRVAASQDGESMLLRLSGGQGWRFHAAGGSLALEDSVYIPAPDSVRKSNQIVVSGTLDEPAAEATDGAAAAPAALVRWAFKRERRGG